MNHEHWYIHINYKHIELQSIKAKVHVTNIIQYSKKNIRTFMRDLRINKSNGNVNNDTDDNNNTLIGCTL